MTEVTIGGARLLNCDCMELMRDTPDNYYQLALVDPPYGIGAAEKPISMGKWKRDIHQSKVWDSAIPSAEYFTELERVSANQIIWGGNYFLDFLGSTRCMIVWDKNNGTNMMADCELAWTSFDSSVRKFTRSHIDDHNAGISRIHPTQKPIALYSWLLQNYAKPGDKILDTHMGSGSIAIATNKMGFELTACELDKDYYDAACNRIADALRQEDMFMEAVKSPVQCVLA